MDGTDEEHCECKMLGAARYFRRKYFNLLSGSFTQRHIVQSTSQVTFYCLRYATRTDRVTSCCCVEHRAERVAFSGSRVATSWEQTSRKSHIWLETRR
ncbi:hypothetical protein EYF80_062155 [Liparis tanakae]|uniref:Uncharacterized protein n=1 Tax=Liparis tanakae TaxID=230148 RepID=A0A4Z2EFN2_9TELE|nr:hypothetical protein EYF80_062155 [Liparis tanakae]